MKSNIINYIILISVIVLVLYFVIRIQKYEIRTDGIRQAVDGNGESHYLGRGDKSENVEILLNRIEWSTYLNQRISIWGRFFISTIIATTLIIILLYRELPSPKDIIIIIFVIFISFYAFHNFMYTHADVYNDYYMKNNIGIIRKKLNLKSYVDPTKPIGPFVDRPYVMNH